MEYRHEVFLKVLKFIADNEPINLDYKYDDWNYVLYLHDERLISGYISEKDEALRPKVIINVTLRESGKRYLKQLLAESNKKQK